MPRGEMVGADASDGEAGGEVCEWADAMDDDLACKGGRPIVEGSPRDAWRGGDGTAEAGSGGRSDAGGGLEGKGCLRREEDAIWDRRPAGRPNVVRGRGAAYVLDAGGSGGGSDGGGPGGGGLAHFPIPFPTPFDTSLLVRAPTLPIALVEPGLSHRATSPRNPSSPVPDADPSGRVGAAVEMGVRGCLARTEWDEVDGMDEAEVRSPAVLACECDENDEGGRVDPAEADEGAIADSIDEADELRARGAGPTLFITQRASERAREAAGLSRNAECRVDDAVTELRATL